jgi:hypothetical protein
MQHLFHLQRTAIRQYISQIARQVAKNGQAGDCGADLADAGRVTERLARYSTATPVANSPAPRLMETPITNCRSERFPAALLTVSTRYFTLSGRWRSGEEGDVLSAFSPLAGRVFN